MSLYNLKSSDGSWRITKFTNDLDVEASYLLSETECGCPAGSRPTCRHRQMLPKMLAVGAEDSPMFYDFDKDQFFEPLSEPSPIVADGSAQRALLIEAENEVAPAGCSAELVEPSIAAYTELPSDSTPEQVAEAFSGLVTRSVLSAPLRDENEVESDLSRALSEPHSTTVSATDFDSVDVGSNPAVAASVHPTIGKIKRRV